MMQDGKYSFRFNGYTMSNGGSFYLVGVGTMVLSNQVISSGGESSSITRLSGGGAALAHARYTLDGNYEVTAGGIHPANIKFTETGGQGQVLESQFDLVPAGEDRFWFISTQTLDVTQGSIVADEVVSGEAVWTGPISSTAEVASARS
jgi:hypothetical protein